MVLELGQANLNIKCYVTGKLKQIKHALIVENDRRRCAWTISRCWDALEDVGYH